MSDYESFKENLNHAARHWANASKATLKNTHENVKATTLHSYQSGKVYCRTIQACPDKLLWDVRHKKRRAKRRYQLCTATTPCNQQSFEKAFYYDIPK